MARAGLLVGRQPVEVRMTESVGEDHATRRLVLQHLLDEVEEGAMVLTVGRHVALEGGETRMRGGARGQGSAL